MGSIARINKEILRLAIPSIFANITVPLVGMVDIAVAGHISAGHGFATASLIGGIAIGTMLFDLLYWNFGFLRISTGGLTAQAYGRGDTRECANALTRSVGLAMGIALCLIAIQWIFVQAAFLVVKCSPEVRTLAQQYFYIRIWAAPATLMLMAFKGWFIGMQDSVSAMTTDLVVNCVNIVASVFLSLGFAFLSSAPTSGSLALSDPSAGSFVSTCPTSGSLASWQGMGFPGIALGTVIAQFTGLACAVILLLCKYRRKVFAGMSMTDFRNAFRGGETKKFFSMNGDIFVRSICFILIYIGFTIISARYGDVLLACCSIMMKLLMIFSYFTDGFAYAGEAMVGKYIGARDNGSLRLSIRWNFVWCIGLAVLFMFVYGFGGVPLLRFMTSDPTVIEAARAFLPWLLLMPVAGCAAFTWDGIFIGATATRSIRNSMLWAVVAFFAVWLLGSLALSLLAPPLPEALAPASASAAADLSASSASLATGAVATVDELAIHILMAAYFAHLLARSLVLTLDFFKH